jgi:putative aldouronate transport system substrate-binding protein
METFMLRKNEKIATIVIVLIVLFAGPASAGGSTQKSANPVLPGPTSAGPVTYPVSGSPKITVLRIADSANLSLTGYTTYNDTPGVKVLEKNTGIDVEFIEPADNTAFLLYLAGGNTPDIIMASKYFYPGGVPKMVDDGLATDLTELLPGYAPDYWKLINSSKDYISSIQELDGKHFALAGYLSMPGAINLAWRGFIARKEYLDRLKMAPPETPDELYQYLSRSKSELNVEIPFSANSGWFPWIFQYGFITSGFGLPKAGVYQVGGKVHYGAYEPKYKDALAFMHKLYAEKLMDNNFAVTDEATGNANIISGKSALSLTAASRIANMAVAANSSNFHLIGLPAMTTAKGVTPLYSEIDGLVTTGYWCWLPEKCRDVPNSLKLLNYLFTKEGHILANFGEENLTFTYSNGKPTFTEYVTHNPKGVSLDGLIRVHGLLNFPIVQDKDMVVQRYPLQEQVDAMNAWAKSDTAKYRISNNSILSEFTDEYAMLTTDINTFINESQAQFISGALPIEQFDSYYIPALKKMGMDRLLEILQISYDAYNK